MTQKNSYIYPDADYFEGVDKLTLQIHELRHSIFDLLAGSFTSNFAENIGLSARNIIVENLHGSGVHLGYGALTGLAVVDFVKKDSAKLGIKSNLKKVDPVSPETISTGFLLDNLPNKSQKSIDERYFHTFRPTIEALGGLYGFDGECAQTVYARESVVSGFIAGANTIISMCYDWEKWTAQTRILAVENRRRR